MPILMRHLKSLNSVIRKTERRAKKLYPSIKWFVGLPSLDIEENFGEGFILRGVKGKDLSEFFILKEDPRIENWIHMIAISLDKQVREE